MINDELPARIMSGKVIVRSHVARFTENEVIFVDGIKEEVDCVICATGYDTKFPFISDNILPGKHISKDKNTAHCGNPTTFR